jgi:hypothetical protein
MFTSLSHRLNHGFALPQVQGGRTLKPAEGDLFLGREGYGVAEIVNREAGTIAFTS